MSIQIQSGIPANVVEIGNEITQGVVDGLMSASPSASSSNPYVTVNGVSGVYLPLAGGTMTGDIGVNYNDLNQVTSIVFADSTVQTTAPVGAGAGTWGSITGTLSSQTDLQNALNTKLTASSNLSDLADAGTARTNLGVAYATNAETVAGTSTTNVVSPSNISAIRPINRYTRDFDFGVASWAIHSSGVPAIVQSAWAKSVINQTNVGFGALSFAITPNFNATYGGNTSYLNFDASYEITFTVTWTESTTSNNSIKRLGVGKNLAYVAGDLTVKGFNLRRIGRGVLELQVHNGTTLTTVASTFDAGANGMSEIKLTSNGLGTCTLWANGTQIASTTGGPTGSSSAGNTRLFLENQVLATLTTAHQLETYAWRVSRSF